MQTLVTGSAGLVGPRLCSDLRERGDLVVECDPATGGDVLDAAGLARAAEGRDGIVHCALVLPNPGESEDLLAVNLQALENVLAAAERARVQRIVFLSSVDSLGVFKGERAPDYLPLDDHHPCYGATPYGLMKRRCEELCAERARPDLSVICLRPPGVWAPETYDWVQGERDKRPSFEWDPFWEYGAFIDVRDLSAACVRALEVECDGYECVLVAASDITTSGRTSRELAEFVHPDVEWCGGAEYTEDPCRSLVDTGPAQRLLLWEPRYRWADWVAGRSG